MKHSPTYGYFPHPCEYRNERCRVLAQDGNRVLIEHGDKRVWDYAQFTQPLREDFEVERLKAEYRKRALPPAYVPRRKEPKTPVELLWGA